MVRTGSFSNSFKALGRVVPSCELFLDGFGWGPVRINVSLVPPGAEPISPRRLPQQISYAVLVCQRGYNHG